MVNQEGFREVMSRFATGVTLVTGANEEGGLVGFTVNSVASVSLEPRLVLFCGERHSASLPTLLDTKQFAISVLGADDVSLARRFADEIRGERFKETRLRVSESGVPILSSALAWMECRVWKSFEAGDHVVVIGEVTDCGVASTGEPLVFFGGAFGSFDRRPGSRR